MKPRRLVRKWNDATAALLKRVPVILRACRRRASASDVHELRVALRRLRLFLRLARPFLDAAAVTRFVDWSRRVCDAAGPVRDLDVALEWMGGKPDAESVRTLASAHRVRAANAFKKAVARMRCPRGRDPFRIEEARAEGTRLIGRFEKRIKALRKAVPDAVRSYPRLDTERRHELRRRIRQWRYLRELEARLGAGAGDPSHEALLRSQEAMGELQNLDLVATLFRSSALRPPRELSTALRKDQALWRKRTQKRLDALDRRASG